MATSPENFRSGRRVVRFLPAGHQYSPEKLFKEGGEKGGFSLGSSSLEKYIGKNQFNDDSANGAIAL